MSEFMVHYVGGPADGCTELMDQAKQPITAYMTTDTDGYYAFDYEVSGQRIGVSGLELTNEDVIARWHQRSSACDFTDGDTVIIRATGARATAFAPTTRLHADGSAREGWTIAIEAKLIFVAADEIRIARPEELEL